jgi:ribosome recycling factor
MPANVPFDIKDLEKRMDGAVAALKTEFSGLRTGRANVHLLDPVMVEAYGASTPLNQVGAVSAPEPRMLAVAVWDRGVVTAVEKAIRSSGLGVNPIVDGQTIRVPIPPLNEERRRELAKLASKYSEAAKVAVRNVRRDGMEHLKKLEKDGDISEDQKKKNETLVQTATDKFVKTIDEALKIKEEEIMQV